ncbi:Mu transposase domain-containing protein [Pectobacterium quasiaquaticum]|uniref:Mu transposase domain-containing protein n=1 Tax=Pectobacterium quasiaquaticum TaxID=2774015 RepID=UPI003D366EB3
MYEQLDKPALKALPPYRYEYVDIRRAKVGPDYHVLYGKHAYSVLHALVGSHIDIEAGARLVRLYHRGTLVAQHPRAQQQRGFTTQAEICRSRTGSNAGARTGCCPGEKASAVPPVPWWPGICTTGHIRNRLTGPAWDCSILAGNIAMPDWRMPASRRCYWRDPGGR